ncbi:MAG: AMP-binding protein [Verrucomicrobiota bacterium]
MENFVERLASGENLILENPGLRNIGKDVEEAARKAGLRGHCIFRTSGSTGDPKFVCLSREALNASAKAVNDFLDVTAEDRWMNALPFFHVGGFGISLRASLSGSRCLELRGKWNAEEFVSRCLADGVTLTSLVPTQSSDIVSRSLQCPETMRAVLVGGGALSLSLLERLRGLGWPVRRTYGMTEAGSQIATEDEEGRMQVLPIWETKTLKDGLLAIRGDALLSGYLVADGGAFSFRNPKDENGWFLTADKVRFEKGVMHFEGRADQTVKVMGELVDLFGLELRLKNSRSDNGDVVLFPVPDERRGFRIFGFVEGMEGETEKLLAEFNASVVGYERLEKIVSVPELPRTALGKIDRPKLAELLPD